MIFRKSATRPIQKGHGDERRHSYEENCRTDVVDPLADSETESGNAHGGGDYDEGSGDDDNEDLSEDEIEQPEFFAERGAVGLNFGLGLMARIIDGRHWV